VAPDSDPRQERDLARERVLTARSDMADELAVLEASGRAALDVKSRLQKNPAKVAAVAGGIGFLALKGPQRIVRGVRRAVFGAPPPLPKAMLPDEIEASLRKLGRDGDKVRGVLERDFADYAKKSQARRDGLRTIILLSALRPLLKSGVERGVSFLVNPDKEGFASRLDQVRERLEQERVARSGEAIAQEPIPTDVVPPGAPSSTGTTAG
jgi:hypothetical protein